MKARLCIFVWLVCGVASALAEDDASVDLGRVLDVAREVFLIASKREGRAEVKVEEAIRGSVNRLGSANELARFAIVVWHLSYPDLIPDLHDQNGCLMVAFWTALDRLAKDKSEAGGNAILAIEKEILPLDGGEKLEFDRYKKMQKRGPMVPGER